ncbi:hypothetical protein L1987_24779 [Smallanthus sonchifolius]|uniref:Uncharacterized protein n=1 Tax=Smallanthus sonchifolius TaxID=185202 RepID=A0ACB9IMR7_9ASTR|nr:hypothetical protein L1987_24779 [Smallanthus sonchifolius]
MRVTPSPVAPNRPFNRPFVSGDDSLGKRRGGIEPRAPDFQSNRDRSKRDGLWFCYPSPPHRRTSRATDFIWHLKWRTGLKFLLTTQHSAMIADEGTVTGFLLAGVGIVDLRRKTYYLIVDSRLY